MIDSTVNQSIADTNAMVRSGNNDALIDTLTLSYEQMSWLQTLFAAIINDNERIHTADLADIGYHLTEIWADNYAVMREDIEQTVDLRSEI